MVKASRISNWFGNRGSGEDVHDLNQNWPHQLLKGLIGGNGNFLRIVSSVSDQILEA